MKVAHLSQSTEAQVTFRDGLGVRVRAESETGESVERLQLVPAFAPVDHAIRDRVSRLANLQHVKFARLRTFEKGKTGEGPTVVSAWVEGTRVSDILMLAGHGLLCVDAGPALQITREVLAALTILHDSRNVTHGALGPERIVLTPHGRVVIVEHVLAQALDKLQLPRHQLWRDWRIATPPAAGPARFDVRTDLAQVGLFVLALLIGRPLDEEEYPHRIRGLLLTVQARLASSPAKALASDLLSWLERLLPIDARRAFTTVRDAQQGFEAVVAQAGRAVGMSPAKVKALLATHAALMVDAVESEASTDEPSGPAPAAATPPPAVDELVVRCEDMDTAPLPAPVGQAPPPSLEESGVETVADVGASTSVDPMMVPGADEMVDIEALLRLAAELEEAGPPSHAAAFESEAPEAPVDPLETTLAVGAIDVPARPVTPTLPPFELVADVDQEEPTLDDVRALEEEVDLGGRLAFLTQSRPADEHLWQDETSSRDDLEAEREQLRQRFADILQSVAPPQVPDVALVTLAGPVVTEGAPAGEPLSLVQDAARWSFEVAVAWPPQPADEAAGTGDESGDTVEPMSGADASGADTVIAAAPTPAATRVVHESFDAMLDKPPAPSWWQRALGWNRGSHVATVPVSVETLESRDTVEAPSVASTTPIPPDPRADVASQPVFGTGKFTSLSEAMDAASDAPKAVEHATEVRAEDNVGQAASLFRKVEFDDAPESSRLAAPHTAVPTDIVTVSGDGDGLASGVPSEDCEARPVAKDYTTGQLIVEPARAERTALADSDLLEPVNVDAASGLGAAPEMEVVATPTDATALAELSHHHAGAVLSESGPELDAEDAVDVLPDESALEPVLADLDVAPAVAIGGQPAEAATLIARSLAEDEHTSAILDESATSLERTSDDCGDVAQLLEATSDTGVSPGDVTGATAEEAGSVAADVTPMPVSASTADVVTAWPDASKVSSAAAEAPSETTDGADATAAEVGPVAADVTPMPVSASTADVVTAWPDASKVSSAAAEVPSEVPGGADATVAEVGPVAADVTPMPVGASDVPVVAATRPRSKRRRVRKRKVTRVPVVSAMPLAPTVAPDESEPAPADVDMAAEPGVVAAGPTTSTPDGLAASTSLGRSSRPVSLVERDVPSWAPPENFEAIAAEARRRKLTPPSTPVESAPEAQPADTLSGSVALPPSSQPLVALLPAAVVPPAAGPLVTPLAEALPPVSAVREQLSPRTVVVFRSQINWRRTIAASMVLALLEGAAFAAAWWWVHPGARGTLVVQTSQPGIEVLLDGAPVGETPFREDLAPGRHKLTLRQGTRVREMPVEISAGVVTTQTLAWPDGHAARVGALTVTSAPSDAEVLVGGRVRGRTPLTLDGLAAGRQTVTLRSQSGTVSATAVVRAGETTTIDVPIFAGWVVVHAPVDLAVTVGGTRVGSNLDGQILLAPGTHRIDVANERLGFADTLTTTVEPGRTRHLNVTLPEMLVDAPGLDGVEVWVDGEHRGTLPAAVRVPLGTHEVLLRHPDGTERRRTLTVRADIPLRLD